MGYSIRKNVYVNRHLYAVALDRVKKAFGRKFYKTPDGLDEKDPDLDEILSIFVVLFDEKYKEQREEKEHD